MYTPTNWVDRAVQFVRRYRDQNNNQYIFTPDEGTITNEGTLFSAANMNKIEQGITAIDADLFNVKLNLAKSKFDIQGNLPAGQIPEKQFVVDAFNDSSGINSGLSSNYQYDSSNKLVYSNTPQEVVIPTGGSGNFVLPNNGSAISQRIKVTANMVGSTKLKVSVGFAGYGGSGVSGYARIQQDSSGIPGASITTSDLNISSMAYISMQLLGDIQLTRPLVLNEYIWITVGYTSGANTSIINYNTANPYADGYMATYSGSSWTQITGSDMSCIVQPYIANWTVVENADSAAINPASGWISSDMVLNGGTATVYMSRDGGTTWTTITPDTLTALINGTGTNIMVKVVVSNGSNTLLKALGWGWM